MHNLAVEHAAARAVVWIVEEDCLAQESLAARVEMLGHAAVAFVDLKAALLSQGAEPALLLIGCDDLSAAKLDRLNGARQTWAARCIVVSKNVTVTDAVAILRRGFDGVLEYPLQMAALRRELDALLTKPTRGSSDDDARRKVQTLSERRQRILKLIAEGLPNKLIASRLNLGLRTIEKERAALFDDLDVRTAAEAAGILARANLETPIPIPSLAMHAPHLPAGQHASAR